MRESEKQETREKEKASSRVTEWVTGDLTTGICAGPQQSISGCWPTQAGGTVPGLLVATYRRCVPRMYCVWVISVKVGRQACARAC